MKSTFNSHIFPHPLFCETIPYSPSVDFTQEPSHQEHLQPLGSYSQTEVLLSPCFFYPKYCMRFAFALDVVPTTFEHSPHNPHHKDGTPKTLSCSIPPATLRALRSRPLTRPPGSHRIVLDIKTETSLTEHLT